MTEDATDLRAHLESLLSLCEKAEKIRGLCDHDRFLNDDLAQLAIFALIGQFGEMSRRMLQRFPEFCARHPDLPFAKAKGMRNRVIHEYEGVDIATVWSTFETAIPMFGSALRPIIEDMDRNHGPSIP
ncbi:MAG: DUF86 domain-containing protein [Rhizobiaceae bacterium]|jgi:uncharacterized protein with HEPN domain|nr:DUF86 domain-containing protein [Rhizobiaceae bacterium]